MPVLAAIDVGSNALRLVIADVDADRHITTLEYVREPVRLGEDVFAGGTISDASIERASEAFRKFRDLIDKHGAKWVRAVSTSACREALNRELFLDRIAQSSEIDLTVIGEEEEARLIYLAVADRVPLKGKVAMLVDIGGGSTEVTLVSAGQILATESFKMGSVRLLQLLRDSKRGEREFHQLLREYLDSTQRKIKKELGKEPIDLCIGTGGNIEALGDLRRDLLKRDRDSHLSVDDLDDLVKRLQSLSYEERVRELGLRPDRADVIVPASMILQKVVKQAGVREVVIPRVGLKDGLLIDMVQELYGEKRAASRDLVLSSAHQLGAKYQFDEPHGKTVAHLAVSLFDQTKQLHGCSAEHRLLLEVAALLHDIGNFVNMRDHHKHSQYLLMATQLIGLTQSQQSLVANIARYHRKSMPKIQHDSYRALSGKERVLVAKLAAILRLADAMDNEHGSRVKTIETTYKKPNLTIRLEGEGDLLLEKWALTKKAEMFEEVFGVKIVVEE
jgi:exopolyphosphatase / guanosine-5'-triphosphate,3'-diphosphate pyrophosphatase